MIAITETVARRAVAQVLAVHRPKRRYQVEPEEGSWDCPRDALEAHGLDADDDLELLHTFDVCVACGDIEICDADDHECDFEAAVWPCRTIEALDKVFPRVDFTATPDDRDHWDDLVSDLCGVEPQHAATRPRRQLDLWTTHAA